MSIAFAAIPSRAGGTPLAQTVERSLALAAFIVLPLALHLLPLHRTLALCDRWPRFTGRRLEPIALASRARRWLSHRRGPWAGECLGHALLLYTLLRQHGYAGRLHIGVHGGAALFVAHAWVTLGGMPVGEDPRALVRYTALVTHGG